MIHLLHKLLEVVWSEELVPPTWREGLIVICLFKKGDKEDPGNYFIERSWKVFLVNDRLVQSLEGSGVLHEGQAGFRAKRSCVDNIYCMY